MKIYTFVCPNGHQFEGWLKTDDWAAEAKAGRLSCPMCGSTELARLPDAPNFSAVQGTTRTDIETDRRQRAEASAKAAQQQAESALFRKMREISAQAEDVGAQFPSEARRIAAGEAPKRLIKGQSTPEQTIELIEEGIGVMPLPDFIEKSN